MQSESIKTIHNTDKSICILDDYSYQESLTLKLDEQYSDFDQEIINEIVLWKVNRYSELNNRTLELINCIGTEDEILDLDLTREILLNLLDKDQKGIRLAMASTILRFKNPKIYQIIDQRVYRYIFGKELKYSLAKIDQQIDIYLEYLDKLKEVCSVHNIDFVTSDRLLYVLDKKHNKGIKLKGY